MNQEVVVLCQPVVLILENASCWLGGWGYVFDLREALQSFHFTINGGVDSLSSCSG